MPGLTTYILLFRGVGGATKLPVGPLKEALTNAGFKNATTYISSGNALVQSALSREETIAKVAALCKKKFAFDKAIFAPTAAEWKAVMDSNPFLKAAATPSLLHAALLEGTPTPAAMKALLAVAVEGEQLKVVKGGPSELFGGYDVAYVHTPSGFGTSKLAAKFDKGLGVVNTARNWNSVLKLNELALAIDTK
ncbi:MAG TPA: DUF1697 domain-containing protein [Flavobacteriales bacterium]|jgi:uncharacterized protein (DUF1697 family)|nr:DUF1697 domain-containing protein [Flavobacteriales bacterium]